MTDTTFNLAHWQEDLQQLELGQQKITSAVFKHVTSVLGARPHQRHSSLKSQSDYQTILRTKRHEMYWLVMDTRMGFLRLTYPDWDDSLSPDAPFRAVRTQWTDKKRDKRIDLPRDASTVDVGQLLALIDRIHEMANAHYDA